MTKRYFKATNGTYTVFRASESKTYRFGWMKLGQVMRRAADGDWEYYGEVIPLDLGFTNPFTTPKGVSGPFPAIEIGKGEYMALVTIKTKRIQAWRAEREAAGQTHFSSTSPGDSWVRNDELPEGLYVGPTPPKAHDDIEWSE
jgi:hypothetical protein